LSAATSVMLWAQRVLLRRQAPSHQVLDIAADATIEDAQVAFHKIARIAHPDLHRHELSAEELEVLTSAYAIVAGAYQSFRTQGGARTNAPAPSSAPPPAAEVPAATLPDHPEQAMSSKALLYYRKAELALKRADLKGAVLQIKLAIAADPVSAFLRSALAQAEAERGKSK
jgi:hypothetical protein